MNQLEVLADIASRGLLVGSSTPSGLDNSLPSTQQTSAPTRALSDEGSTNKESPRSTSDSSSETSLCDERSTAVALNKAVDMEVGVLNTILPNASPPSSETSGIGISTSPPLFDAQNVPHTPEVLAREELDILQTFVPSSDSSIVAAGSLEVPVPTADRIGPITPKDSPCGTVEQPQYPPATRVLPSGLPAMTLGEATVPTERADVTTSSVPSPHVAENAAWSALQIAERASTRLACKAASQPHTSSDSPQTPHATADIEMQASTTSQTAADVSSITDGLAGHSFDEPSKLAGVKVRLHLPSTPATPDRLQKPLNLASPKGAKPYVEILKFNVTAPTPVKRDHVFPTPESPTAGGSSMNADPAHFEDANIGDVVMGDPETSGRSLRKRTQSVLLRDFVRNPSDSESRSPSPRPPPSKKKRKESNDPGSTHSDSSVRLPKKRSKKVATAASAPFPSTHAQEPSLGGDPGPTVPVSQASLTSTRRPAAKGSLSTSSGPFIQKDRCIKFHTTIPRCHACIRKKTGELCRYIDLRQFPGGTPQAPTGQPIWIDDPREPPQVSYPSSWNVIPTPQQTKRVLKVVADALLPYLAKELSHTRLPEIIRRNRELECRASCDYCATSIFGAGWICKQCAREFCSDCRDRIVHLADKCSSPEEVKERMKSRSETSLKREDNRLMYCQGGKVEHYGRDLRPITRFRKDELETTISDMGTILIESKMDLSSTVEPETDSSNQPMPIIRHDPSDPIDPSGVGTLPFHVFSAGGLTEEIFTPLWAKGQTVVVTGLLDIFQFQWTPDEFIRRYGSQTCHVVDCYDNNQTPIAMNVERFFSQFGHYDGRKTCWKLKDWPPTSLFSTEFPELFKDFADAVPVPNYTRRDGVLNLAAHYPTNPEVVVPDIGPKMYNAFESSELPGGKGSTRLHMDMADAVNVMLHASPRQDGSPGCAVWDIYRAEDAKKIRHFLHEKFGFSKTDPIHSQHHYLDSDLRKELFEREGVKGWRIYQKPGEAVFIPAGCAHQVCNLADCIKVAVDFVSPENIGRCELLTAEFRQQNLASVWKDDVLQVRHTLLHTWNSMKRNHPSLSQNNLLAAASTTPGNAQAN